MDLKNRKANVNGQGEPRVLRELGGISKGCRGTSELIPKLERTR